MSSPGALQTGIDILSTTVSTLGSVRKSSLSSPAGNCNQKVCGLRAGIGIQGTNSKPVAWIVSAAIPNMTNPSKNCPSEPAPSSLGPIDFSPSRYWDRPALRQTTPVARFGNAFVFRGTFYLPGHAAAVMYWRGIAKLYLQKPDEAAAEKAFLRSVELDPTAYFVYIQLGNLYLKRGDQERALRAYSDALKFAGNDSHFHSQIQEQIQRVSAENLANIAPLRDPYME